MRTPPTGWAALWEVPHRVTYKFDIGGTTYLAGDYVDTPVIIRPLMEKAIFGRVCTGSLNVRIRPKGAIARAASVIAYCRLENNTTQSDWLEMGHFWVSKRKTRGEILELDCTDRMSFTGQTYQDVTTFTTWPQKMIDVLDDIADIMNVDIDTRTVIIDSTDYIIEYPNEDVLISEILSNIAAAHGGSFVMTEEGKLRLVKFPHNGNISVYVYDSNDSLYDTARFILAGVDIADRYIDFKTISTGLKTISRVTLTDIDGDQYTYGDDSGIEIGTDFWYATQAICNSVGAATCGKQFVPYEMKGAYFNPLIEVGDAFTVMFGGASLVLIANYIKTACTYGFSSDVSNLMEEDDEDEIPYISRAQVAAKRYVSEMKSYHGNRINRTEGFVSEFIENGVAVARMIANSNQFVMQQYDSTNHRWIDCIYFDAVNRHYVISGDVELVGGDYYEKQSYLTIDSNGVDIAGNEYVRIKASSASTDYWAFTMYGLTHVGTNAMSFRFGALSTLVDPPVTAGIFDYDHNTSIKNSIAFLASDRTNSLYQTFLLWGAETVDNVMRGCLRPNTHLGAILGHPSCRWSTGYFGAVSANGDISAGGNISAGGSMSASGNSSASAVYASGSEGVHTNMLKTYSGGAINIYLHDYSHSFYFSKDGDTAVWFAGRDNSFMSAMYIEANDWGDRSSRQVKHDIKKLDEVGDIIDGLRPVSFVYDDDGTEKKRFGLIYEETIDVLPEICLDNSRSLALNYVELVPLLLREIQSLRKRVSDLEALQNKEG